MVFVVGFDCLEVSALDAVSNVPLNPCLYQLNVPVTVCKFFTASFPVACDLSCLAN